MKSVLVPAGVFALLVFYKGVMTMINYLAQPTMTSHWSGLLHLMVLSGHYTLNRFSEHPLVYSCILTVLVFWYRLRRPLDFVKVVEYPELDNQTDSRKKNETHRMTRASSRRFPNPEKLPPVFPNGWIPILESRLLTKGKVKPVSAVGEELAVFRSESGEVFVLDAFCPHLGAHLGFGSKINGSCIECPFHGWKFDGATGNCVGTSYSNKIPSSAKLKMWKSCEVNKVIFIWYHAEGENPSWTIPRIPDINDDDCFTYRGRTEHIVDSHIQDIGENGADVAHFIKLHNPSVLAGGTTWLLHQARGAFNVHTWNVEWLEGPQPHESCSNLKHGVEILGYNIPSLGFDLTITQVGPAFAKVLVESCLGRGYFVQIIIPLGPHKMKVVHMFYGEPKMLNIVSRGFLYAESIMIGIYTFILVRPELQRVFYQRSLAWIVNSKGMSIFGTVSGISIIQSWWPRTGLFPSTDVGFYSSTLNTAQPFKTS